MKKVLILCCLMLLISEIQARHLHPRSLVKAGDIKLENYSKGDSWVAEVDGVPIDVIRNIKPNRFVPINSVFFFKSYPPCEDGLERDLLGICREVWD